MFNEISIISINELKGKEPILCHCHIELENYYGEDEYRLKITFLDGPLQYVDIKTDIDVLKED